MGVDLHSPNHDASMSYGAFNRMRTELAGIILGDEWREHYASLGDCSTTEDYDAHDEVTNELCNGLSKAETCFVEFLYMSDCGGILGEYSCEYIWTLMQLNREKWINDKTTYAYLAREPFALADFCDMLADGHDNGYGVQWM